MEQFLYLHNIMQNLHNQFLKFAKEESISISFENWPLNLEKNLSLFRNFHFIHKFSILQYCQHWIYHKPKLLENLDFAKTWITLHPKCFHLFPSSMQHQQDILRIYLSNYPSKIRSFSLSEDFLLELLYLNTKIYFYLSKKQKNKISFVHTALLGNQNFIKTYQIYRQLPFQYKNNPSLQKIALNLDWEVINHIEHPSKEYFQIAFDNLFEQEETIHLGNFYKIFQIIPKNYLDCNLFESILFYFEQHFHKLNENLFAQINIFFEKFSHNHFLKNFFQTIDFLNIEKDLSLLSGLYKKYKIYSFYHYFEQHVPIHHCEKNLLKI